MSILIAKRSEAQFNGLTDQELANQFLNAIGCANPSIEDRIAAYPILFDAQYFLECYAPNEVFASAVALIQRAECLGWRADARAYRRFQKSQPDRSPEDADIGLAFALAEARARKLN
jgi:hypothetical protein